MTNLSGRSRENLQLSAAQEERISPSSAAQSGSSYEAQGGLSQASPQAHDQQRELHRKPPRGLSQRIMLALTVLLTGLAALYSAAMVGVIGCVWRRAGIEACAGPVSGLPVRVY